MADFSNHDPSFYADTLHIKINICIEIRDWIQLTGITLVGIGLIFSFLCNRNQIKIFNEYAKLNFLREYTKKYQDIILEFPENINDDDFDFDELEDKVEVKTLRYMRVYFDLCNEEYDLWREGYINERIWNIWQEGIEFAFSKQAFIDAWKIIKFDTKFYPAFTKWVNKIIEKHKRDSNGEN